MVGEEIHPEGFVTIDVRGFSILQGIVDCAADIMLCLDSTLDTLSVFLYEEERMSKRCKHLDKPTVGDSLPDAASNTIRSTLVEQQRDVVYHRKKAEALIVKAQNTQNFVRIMLLVGSLELTFIFLRSPLSSSAPPAIILTSR